MKASERLTDFVADALRQGKSRDEIETVLQSAGWSPSEIATATRTWAEVDFPVPVPRPRPIVSARTAFFYGLMFLALGVTAVQTVGLLFNLINLWVPDVTEVYPRWNADSARFTLSWIIVFGPLFLILNQRAARSRRDDPAERRSAIRKWLGYVAIFLAAVALLGDLIWVIYSLLNGDITARIAAKAAVLAVIAGGIFFYYRAEMAEIDDG